MNEIKEKQHFTPFIPADQNRHANSVEPDETALFDLSHQDLHCLPFPFVFLADFPICDIGQVQIQRWKSPFWKLRVERVNSCVPNLLFF